MIRQIKLIELFGGIGSPRKALERLKIPFESIDYVEIDKYVVKSYNAMYEENYEPQDVSKVHYKNINCDLLVHGSPCQDFSIAGKQAGGDKGSGTRSSLLYESVRIIKETDPNVVIWENVKNVLSKKHKGNFDNYLTEMSNLGYVNYYQVLNSKDYDVPQNRERVITVSIKRDLNKTFSFPKKQELKLRLKDVLEKNVDKKYYLSDRMKAYINSYDKKYKVCDTRLVLNRTIASCISTRTGQNRADSSDYICKDLPENINIAGVDLAKYNIRKLTPKECFRLMGYDDSDFDKAVKVNSNTQLYKQAGNSIVVNVLEEVFKQLYKQL